MIGVGILRKIIPCDYDGVNERALPWQDWVSRLRPLPRPEANGQYRALQADPLDSRECADVHEAVGKMRYLNLVKIPFDAELTLAPLHWMISDPGADRLWWNR